MIYKYTSISNNVEGDSKMKWSNDAYRYTSIRNDIERGSKMKCGVHVARSLVCCAVFCRSLLCLLFFRLSLCCLYMSSLGFYVCFFFNLRIMITPSVSKCSVIVFQPGVIRGKQYSSIFYWFLQEWMIKDEDYTCREWVKGALNMSWCMQQCYFFECYSIHCDNSNTIMTGLKTTPDQVV